MLMRWSRRGVNMMVFGVFLFLTAAISRGDLHADEYELPYMLEFDGSGDRVRLDGAQDGFQHFLEGRGSILIRLNPAEILTGGANSRQFAISAGGEITGSHRDLNIGISEGGNWYLVFSDGSEYKIAATGIRPAPEANNWYNVSVVFGGDDRGFYVDGEKLESWEEFSGNTGAWRHDFHIGYSPDRDRDWPGAISDVRFFDRNLSASEIREFMEAESLSGEEDGLVGYWPLDELEGESVYDRSGNENHGTIVGAEWSIDETSVLAEQPGKVFPSLVEAINKHDAIDIRKQALGVLGKLDMAVGDMTPALLDVLNDTEQPGDVRVEAAGILMHVDSDEKEALLSVLEDVLNQPEHRQQAITLLNEIGDDGAQALLAGLVDDLMGELGDEDPAVRRRAVQQLAEVGPAAEQAVPEIKERLDDENEDVVDAAISTLRGIDITAFDGLIKEIEVAPVWSVHALGRPNLLTSGDYQYIAYYDKDAYLSIAQREIGSTDWQYQRFPVRMGWATGGHACLTLALDIDGYIHLSSYRRSLREGPPTPPNKIYYRSEEPHSVDEFERLYMVSEREAPGYPTFIMGPEDELYYTYRAGHSGRGNQIYNIYDPESREWEQVHDGPFFEGRGRMNAYGGVRFGPDGNWHALWVWRNTACNSTNHSPSYARSEDMLEWETAGGEPVELPFTSETEEVLVDPVGPGGGISNMTSGGLGWDSQMRPIRSYHKFDNDGNSQVFNARFEDGEWNIVPSTDWDFRWRYSGGGALPYVVRVRSVSAGEEDGTLQQTVWSRHHGDELIILDEETLEPIERRKPEPPPAWERALYETESDFEARSMEVYTGGDRGESEEDGVRYIWRWEHGGRNRDRSVSRPWPEPTMLRVYKVE